MKYYIADTHFGHQNILSFAKRPFLSTKEMEEVLISNWNQTVKDNDEVYIIGDLFYREDHPERILSKLNGRKTLILGNHDSKWLTDELKTFFVDINTSMEIIDQNHTLFLCHYPMVSYPKQSRAYMIHGHIHNDTLFDYWCILVNYSSTSYRASCFTHHCLMISQDIIKSYTVSTSVRFGLFHPYHNIFIEGLCCCPQYA